MKTVVLKLVIICTTFLLLTQCQSMQLINAEGDYYRSYEKTVTPSKWIPIESDLTFTSLSITAGDSLSMKNVKIVFPGEDTLDIMLDEHYTRENQIKSNLIIAPEPGNEFYIYTGDLNGKIHFHFLNSQASGYNPPQHAPGDKANCNKPPVVQQDEWRAGLDVEPSGEVVATNVKHVILHHTATVNEPDNPEQVVRDIYLDHRLVNGWNDIGYNYVVAHDGTVFAGRDGRGQYETDNVRGAHFCGSNISTMGVGLLGTFSNTTPAEAALQSLDKLIAWKLDKEDIHPESHFSHPLNNNLPAIAGHRQGCSTECPGENWFGELNNTRENTLAIWEECATSSSLTKIQSEENLYIFPNPSSEKTYLTIEGLREIRKILITDQQGTSQNVTYVEINRNPLKYKIDTSELSPGIYNIIVLKNLSSQNINTRLVVV